MVSSGDLEDIVVGIPAVQEFGEEIGIARDVLEANSHGVKGNIVEVGANADMVDASHLANVVDVVGNIGDGAARMGVGLFPISDSLVNRLVGVEMGVQVFEDCSAFLLPLRVLG